MFRFFRRVVRALEILLSVGVQLLRRFWLPLLLSSGAVAAGVASIVLKNDFLQESRYYRWAVWGQGAFSLAVIGDAFAATRKAQQLRLKHDAQVALHVALLAILDERKVADAGVRRQHLGLHIYMVGWSWEEALRLSYPYVHKRLGRLRDDDSKPRSSIAWPRSKGIIGRCWQRRNQTAEGRFGITHRQYLRCSAKEWDEAPADTRMGLTFEEWETLRGYTYVRAVPIQLKGMDRSDYIGCVSLDTTSKDQRHVEALSQPEVTKQLTEVANFIAQAVQTDGAMRPG